MADEATKLEDTAQIAAATETVDAPAPVEATAPAAVLTQIEVPAAKADLAAAPMRARKPRAKKVEAPAKPELAKVAATKTRAPKAQAGRLAAKPVRRTANRASQAEPKATPSAQSHQTGINGAAQRAFSYFKELTMAQNNPTDFLASFQNVFGEFQTKAAEAYEKSTSALAEANDFAKGNVEAAVESGKILASGLQDLGATLVSESRSAFETVSAEVKELAAVKSPSEFFALQGNLARKNFDHAVAQASRNTEAMLKLANEVFSPLSSRVTLAVEKVSKAAA